MLLSPVQASYESNRWNLEAGMQKMRLKLFGYDIAVSYYFGAMIPLAMLLDTTGTVLWGMFAAAVHELGHLWMMRLLKYPKCRIRITVFGFQMVQEEYGGHGFRRDCLISMAGPLVNLLFFSAFAAHSEIARKAACKTHRRFPNWLSAFLISCRFFRWTAARRCIPFYVKNLPYAQQIWQSVRLLFSVYCPSLTWAF